MTGVRPLMTNFKMSVRDFPGGPVVKTHIPNAEGMGWILVRELKSNMQHGMYHKEKMTIKG